VDPRPITDLLSELGLSAPTCTRVLLVDDEFEVLAVLEALLDDDWEVYTAQSGQEALKILSSDTPIDLVITDQRMPEMTGVELLSALADSHPDLYRMVLTAYSDVDPIVAAINNGKVDQFILKPWDPQAIRRLVVEGLAVCERRATMRTVAECLSDRFSEQNQALNTLKGTEAEARAGDQLAFMAWMSAGFIDEVCRIMDNLQSVTESNDSTPEIRLARDSSIRMRTLSDDIVRLSHANVLSERSNHAPRKLISDSVRLLMDEGLDEHNPVHVDIDPSIESICVDPESIKQALLGLLRNAMRAAPAGSPIQVNVRRNGPDLITFEVADKGPGMNDHVILKACQPFFSGFEPPGAGLGLSLCQMVAEAHGGRLALLDNEPSGVIAQIWLREGGA
jgi:signal transduction histidine kinase